MRIEMADQGKAEPLLHEQEGKDISLQTVLTYAKILVKDAIHHRSKVHKMDPHSLLAARIMRNPFWNLLMSICIFGNALLAVPEKPSTFRNYIQPEWDMRINCALEFLCLFIFAVDCGLRWRYFGRQAFLSNRFLALKLVITCFSFINASLSYLIVGFPRFHRLLRPLMLAAHFRNVSSIFGSMLSSIPKVFNVVVILAFHVIVFGVLAHILFGGYHFDDKGIAHCDADSSLGHICSPFTKQCTDYFGNLGGAMNQLFILLTTANYPDVMMPVYTCNRWGSLFFITFLMIGLYFIMNLVLAVNYAHFQDKTRAKTLTAISHRVECLDSAFDLLIDAQSRGLMRGNQGSKRFPWRRRSHFQIDANGEVVDPLKHEQSYSEVMSRAASTGFPFRMRSPDGSIQASQIDPNPHDASDREKAESRMSTRSGYPHLYPSYPRHDDGLQSDAESVLSPKVLDPNDRTHTMVYTTFSILMRALKPSTSEEIISLLYHTIKSPGAPGITKKEFRDLSQFIDVKIRHQRAGPHRHYCFGGLCCGPAFLRFREKLAHIAEHRAFNFIFDLLVLINGVLVLINFALDDASNGTPFHKITSIILNALLYLFVVEVFFKLFALGTYRFLRDGFNVLDIIVIPAAIISQLVVAVFNLPPTVIQKLSFIRLLRLLRSLRAFSGFRTLARTFVSILPTFVRYLSVGLIAFYVFSIIGMECFAGTITHQHPGAVHDTAYAENVYWANNFDTLASSMVTLFELMVVNNWPVIVEGYVAATNYWSMIFFYAWYFVMVIVVLNIITAFLLDDFTVMRAQIADEENGVISEWKRRLIETADRLELSDRQNWLVRRPLRTAQVYELMFKDEIEEYLAELHRKMFEDTASKRTRVDTEASEAEFYIQQRGRRGSLMGPVHHAHVEHQASWTSLQTQRVPFMASHLGSQDRKPEPSGYASSVASTPLDNKGEAWPDEATKRRRQRRRSAVPPPQISAVGRLANRTHAMVHDHDTVSSTHQDHMSLVSYPDTEEEHKKPSRRLVGLGMKGDSVTSHMMNALEADTSEGDTEEQLRPRGGRLAAPKDIVVGAPSPVKEREREAEASSTTSSDSSPDDPSLFRSTMQAAGRPPKTSDFRSASPGSLAAAKSAHSSSFRFSRPPQRSQQASAASRSNSMADEGPPRRFSSSTKSAFERTPSRKRGGQPLAAAPGGNGERK